MHAGNGALPSRLVRASAMCDRSVLDSQCRRLGLCVVKQTAPTPAILDGERNLPSGRLLIYQVETFQCHFQISAVTDVISTYAFVVPWGGCSRQRRLNATAAPTTTRTAFDSYFIKRYLIDRRQAALLNPAKKQRKAATRRVQLLRLMM
jgi:hypothetical protein